MSGGDFMLGGLAIRVAAAAPLSWRLGPAEAAPALRIRVEPADTLPAPHGRRLYEGPRFSVWADGDRLELELTDVARAPRIRVGFRPHGAEIEIALRAPRDADDRLLQDEVLPELLVAHLWPIRGRAYLHAAGSLGPRGVRLFLGSSGQGKSTAAGLLIDAGHRPFTTDRCAAWIDAGAWAAGVPWHGGSQGAGTVAELEALFVLDRARPPGIVRLTGARALAALTANAFLPRWWQGGMAAALAALHALAARAPVFALSSEPDARLLGRVELAVQP